MKIRDDIPSGKGKFPLWYRRRESSRMPVKNAGIALFAVGVACFLTGCGAAKNGNMAGGFIGMGLGQTMGSAMSGVFSNIQNAQDAPKGGKGGKFCSNCGAPVSADVKFCPECGARQSAQKICPKCGAEVKATAKFCPECGAKVE